MNQNNYKLISTLSAIIRNFDTFHSDGKCFFLAKTLQLLLLFFFFYIDELIGKLFDKSKDWTSSDIFYNVNKNPTHAILFDELLCCTTTVESIQFPSFVNQFMCARNICFSLSLRFNQFICWFDFVRIQWTIEVKNAMCSRGNWNEN